MEVDCHCHFSHFLFCLFSRPKIDSMALPCSYREIVAAVWSDTLLPWCLAFVALQLLIIYWSFGPSSPIQDHSPIQSPLVPSVTVTTAALESRTRTRTRTRIRTRTAGMPNKNSPVLFVPVTSAPAARNKTSIPTNTSNSEATSDSNTTSSSDATSDSEAASSNSSSSSSKPARMRVAVRDPTASHFGFGKIAQWARKFRLWAGQCRRYTAAAAGIALAVSLVRAWHIQLHHKVFALDIDLDAAETVRPTPSLVLSNLEELLYTHAGIPSAHLFGFNTTVLNGVPGAPMSLDVVLREMHLLLVDTCGLVARSSLERRANGGGDDQMVRWARLGLEAECAMVMEGVGVANEARDHVMAMESLFEPLGKDGHSLWSHDGLSLSNRILYKVRALRHTCQYGDSFEQSGPTNYQRCSRWLLDALQAVVDSAWWADATYPRLERHLRLALEGVHAIRECLPRIDMLVSTIAQGAEQVAAAQTAMLQRAPQRNSFGSGFWKKRKSLKEETRAIDNRELLRSIMAPRALQHLDSVALEPLQRLLNHTYLQVHDQAMPGWKRLRNQLKAMSAHPIPKVTFARRACSATAPSKVVMVSPMPPEDGIWVDGNVIRYLPTIPQAVKLLTSANQEIIIVSNRIVYEIGLVCYPPATISVSLLY